ncbi:MAG: flavoprotein [Planctomycetota bacterium]
MIRVILGVTGGIAAFKACDLVSELREREIECRVAMTPAATRFIQPLTFCALTGHEVLVDDLSEPFHPPMPHIEWGRWADGVVIAPATADFIGRLAGGLGSDSLSSLMLALDPEKPVILAPAMNTWMWSNEFVQRNLALLRSAGEGRRFRIVEPVEKRLACGDFGIGGLADVRDIADVVAAAVR